MYLGYDIDESLLELAKKGEEELKDIYAKAIGKNIPFQSLFYNCFIARANA